MQMELFLCLEKYVFGRGFSVAPLGIDSKRFSLLLESIINFVEQVHWNINSEVFPL